MASPRNRTAAILILLMQNKNKKQKNFVNILSNDSKRIMQDIANLPTLTNNESGPGSSVGIATGYGLDGSGIESWWGRDFLHLFRPALGPTQPPVQQVPGLSLG